MHLEDFVGKQKSLHGISPGLFCFPMGKQKSPRWYCKQFETGKEKSLRDDALSTYK